MFSFLLFFFSAKMLQFNLNIHSYSCVYFSSYSSCRALTEKTASGLSSVFHVDLALLQSWSFFMCGNPNWVKLNRKLTAINFPFHLASMNSIIFVIWVGWFWKCVGQTRKKWIFSLKRTFLGERQRLVRRLSNQMLSLRLKRHTFFFLFLTYVQLTVFYARNY